MNYDDIINHPHHVSPNRPRMTMEQRAAQFAPFAALTGHKEAIEHTAQGVIEQYERKEEDDDFLPC